MKKIIFVAAAIAALVSCNKDNNDIATENTAVEFTDGVITRASGTEWAAGDKIGIYMFATGTTTVSESNGNIQYSNSKTVASESATFKVVRASETIYYPQDDAAVDFLAYYPYSSTKVGVSDLVYEVDVNTANQADQTLIDLMVSNNLTEQSLSKSALSLKFAHALSQINFVVTAGTGTPSLVGLAITVSDLINNAEYNLTTQKITLGKLVTDLEIADMSAIIIPQTADLTFQFTTTENPMGFEVTKKGMEFNAGESTTLTFILNRTSVSLEGTSTINGWTPIDGGTTEVN